MHARGVSLIGLAHTGEGCGVVREWKVGGCKSDEHQLGGSLAASQAADHPTNGEVTL